MESMPPWIPLCDMQTISMWKISLNIQIFKIKYDFVHNHLNRVSTGIRARALTPEAQRTIRWLIGAMNRTVHRSGDRWCLIFYCCLTVGNCLFVIPVMLYQWFSWFVNDGLTSSWHRREWSQYWWDPRPTWILVPGPRVGAFAKDGLVWF